MLDEDEYAQVGSVLTECMRATKEFRSAHGVPLGDVDLDARFAPARQEFERITGCHESNFRAIYHHRIALYGPPCSSCGKPLRTPQARRCGACGAERGAI